MTVSEALKQYFGYDSLREGQEPLVNALLSGRDVAGIMPTGAGKSLCYQIPGMILPGITLVVSPLISLMSDQVKALNQAGIHAAYINSSLTENQISKALQYASEGVYKIIYVAPERLLTGRFLDFAMNSEISLLAVDEAHCISQWGQDFRPSYRDISEFVSRLPKRPVIGAFTATATEQVKTDIISSLHLDHPEVVVTGFDRPNLYFRVAHRKGGAETDNAILHYVLQHEDESGIIYCATKKNVDSLFQILQSKGISVARYHAGLSAEERKNNQDDFTFDRVRVMVATNAFGMGIDKSNVRYVLHYNMPQSLEYYYQEAGRAGRDGEYAECVLFYSKQDIMINKFLLKQKTGVDGLSGPELREVQQNDLQKLNKMIDYCETNKCLRSFILEYFGESAQDDCGNCSNCVPVEESQEADLLGRKRSSKKTFAGAQLTPIQQELFEQLRTVRSELASAQKVPAFIICGDKSLSDMCGKLPQTEDAFLDVYGMGRQKAESYGESFLAAIRKFVQEHEDLNIVEPVAAVQVSEEKTAEPRPKKIKQLFHMEEEKWNSFEYADSMMVKDIALQLNELKGDNGTSNISAIQINQILLENAYLTSNEVDGRNEKRVTDLGRSAGMSEELRTGARGTYYAIRHNRQAQELIIELLKKSFP